MSAADTEASAPALALDGWERPDNFAPFGTFAEGLAALGQVRKASAEANRYREALEASGASRAEIDAAWSAEVEANRAINPVRRRVVMTPAHGVEIIRKLGLLAEPHDDLFDPSCAADVAVAIQRPEDFALSVEIAALHDDLVRLLAGGGQ